MVCPLLNKSFLGRLSLQLAALVLGTLASRLKGTLPCLVRVLALNTSSSMACPSPLPRLFLLTVARPLVMLVMVWYWALSRLGGTAGGTLGGWLVVRGW